MKTEAIEDRAHQALKFLTDTDELAADLKCKAEMAEAAYAATVDAVVLHSEGPIEIRKAKARTSGEAQAAWDRFVIAQRDYDATANKRKTESLAVEWCRSLYAAYRQGK